MSSDKSDRAVTLVLFLLIAVVAVVAFLPWASWFGAAQQDESSAYIRTVGTWVVWLVLSVPLAAVLSRLWGERFDAFFTKFHQWIAGLPGSSYAIACALGLLMLALVFSWVLFRHNPHLVDTIAQLFQANIFAGGGLTAPAPNEMEFFAASQIVEHEGNWFSQYPPGHSAFLAVGTLVGAPWLINPLFAAGTVLLAYGVARRSLGDVEARISILLFLLSPFVLFMSASYMNHVTTGFFLALALYAALRAIDGGPGRVAIWSAVVGLALAAAATIRPLESAAWAMVLGLWILWRSGWKPAFLAAATCGVGLTPLFAYNALTSGHPLRFGYTLLWGSGHGLGFHTDPWGEPFTPVISFANTALDFQRLNVFMFEWPFPALVFTLVALWVGGNDPRIRKNVFLLAGLLLAAPVAYFFYWHRDNYLGPRFLYASILPAILLTVVGIVALDARLGRWRSIFRLVLLAGVFYGLAVRVPESAGVISGMEPEMKLHPEVESDRAGLEEALVFVKTSWGNRLVGRLWGWDVPASEAEQTFRVVDGCRLQGALDRADSLAYSGRDSIELRAQLRDRLAQWRGQNLPVVKGLLPDPSVRVDTTEALTRRCYQEVQEDRSGFTLYGTLIWRNDPWLDRGVIYARSLGNAKNRKLMEKYPGYEYYLYMPLSPERDAPTVLLRLDTEPQPLDRTGDPNDEG
jgi:hypothetical protein